MNGTRALTTLFLSLYLSAFACVEARASEGADQIEPMQIVVLAVSRSHEGTLANAKNAAAALGFAFSDRGLVFDDVDGLHWPKELEDEISGGGYAPRRFDGACGDTAGAENGCITVELSDSYEGLAPGYFIAVAGLYEKRDGESAARRLEEVRRVAVDARLVDTSLDMGCLH